MQKRRTTAVALGTLVLLALLLALTPTGRAIAQGTTAVLVEVVNTPDVTVKNAVTIGNRPTDPVPIVDISSAARQAFLARFSCAGTVFCAEQLTVPTGKLLVIETYSASCGTDALATAIRSSIEVPRSHGLPSHFYFPLEPSVIAPFGFGGLGRHHEMTAAVRIYANPETDVTFHFRKSPAGQLFFCESSVSGLLLDCGSGPICAAP